VLANLLRVGAGHVSGNKGKFFSAAISADDAASAFVAAHRKFGAFTYHCHAHRLCLVSSPRLGVIPMDPHGAVVEISHDI
jgi:hypothetical protein